MPVYAFVCDCGQHSETYYPMDAPEHTKVLRCPGCGGWMDRDFRGERIGIGGDLPGKHPHGYKKNAYVKGDFGEEDKLYDECMYVEKHASPKEQKDATKTINTMGREFRNEQRAKDTKERWSKVKIEPPRGFDIPSGD